MSTFERKIRKLKRTVKNIVVENSALCDNISKIQNTIDVSKMERDFLLRKLAEYEPEFFTSSTEAVVKYKRKNSDTNSEASMSQRPYEVKKLVGSTSIIKKQVQVGPQIPRLPLILSNDGITVLNFGKIVYDRPAYHTENVIYPTGYKISRVFNGTNFICRILDNGNFPLFEIFKESDQYTKFIGNSADDVHSELLQASECRSSIIIPDGDRFFGLRNKIVVDHLTQLPNAKRLGKLNKSSHSDIDIFKR
ncbi:unnamed protein product [Chironomus riparius]|uniref:Transforming growth factor beta regulator 1 n=1 Tax=Chironomus riparius TaxID=315576 RepID=A0A9N9S9F2_9DIPT|nr:unnamed protein product [Chironomus riparius]